MGEIIVTGPQAHLLVLDLLPARDDVDSETSLRDRIDGGGHAGDQRRRQGQHRRRGVEHDTARHRSQPGHQREGFEIIVPELGLAAEAMELDHRKREFEPVPLGLLDDGLVEGETRLVLR